MLQHIRDRFTGTFALAMLLLICVPFVFFGIHYDFTNSSYAAKVNGHDIPVAQFEQSYRNFLQSNPAVMKQPAATRGQYRNRVLQELIVDDLVEDYLDKHGYRVSDRQVTDVIQQTPDFQKDGKFDKNTYYTVLAQQGYDPARYEGVVRQRLRRSQLERAVGGTALVTPADYRRFLNLVAEQRVVAFATIDAASVASDVQIDNDMIAAYYDENKADFEVPESVDLNYVEISRDQVAKSIDVSDSELHDYYEESKSRYMQDEQREARHILILHGSDDDAAKAKANALLARIKSGEDFATLAKQNSADSATAAQGGDLGQLTRSQLPDALAGPVFGMHEGDVSGPIKSEYGYHIVKLDKIIAPGPLPFDKVRGELLRELQDRKAGEKYSKVERSLSDALFESHDLKTIAAKLGVDVQSAKGFTRKGGEPFDNNQAVIDAVFDSTVLNGGQTTDLVAIDANREAVFAVTEHHAAKVQELDAVRSQVVNALQARQSEKLMIDRADLLLKAVNSGEDLKEAATKANAKFTAAESLNRQDKNIDQLLLVQVFTSVKPTDGKPVNGRVKRLDGGYSVYSLQAVIPGRPESIPLDQRDAGRRALAEQAGQADYMTFMQALYDNAEIVTNKDVLAADDMFQ